MTQIQTLVTGGAGFIGSHVVRRLLRDGHRVRVIDNLSTGTAANLQEVRGDVDFVEGDIRAESDVERATKGVGIIYHLAALPSVPRSIADPWASHDHNVNGTMRLLEAARAAGVQRVVFSSSSSVYGDTEVLPKVETMEPLCRSPYATAKLAGEQYVLAYARANMLEGVALRYFNVFGPRQRPGSAYAAIIPALLDAVRSGAVAHIHGDGEQTRDFTYVDNVVEANVLAGTGPKEQVSGWVVNAGAGSRTSLNGLMSLIEKVTGSPVKREYGPPRAGDVRDSQASVERAQRVLGYRADIGVEEGLSRTWDWFQREMA